MARRVLGSEVAAKGLEAEVAAKGLEAEFARAQWAIVTSVWSA